jgi:hypothetical protein
MVKKNRSQVGIVDCACVIHSTGYDWIYVERLYNMLSRNLPRIRFHVYTEHDRSVPPHMIKHCLEEWPGIKGPKKSWWYKMQLFNAEHHQDNLLYFDLDCVVVKNLAWLPTLPTEKFWTIKDFKYLQNLKYVGINSSVMWWNVKRFEHVWNEFKTKNILTTVKTYYGDQDYLNEVIGNDDRRYFDSRLIESYRWQVKDGGYNFKHRQVNQPGAGAVISGDVSVLVFHGQPKPHQVIDPVIQQFWC